MNRWRIMALLVEAIAEHQYIREASVHPCSATTSEVHEVMHEACMQRVTIDTWTPGRGTLAWWTRWMCSPAPRRTKGRA
jgi:hypothetical protein